MIGVAGIVRSRSSSSRGLLSRGRTNCGGGNLTQYKSYEADADTGDGKLEKQSQDECEKQLSSSDIKFHAAIECFEKEILCILSGLDLSKPHLEVLSNQFHIGDKEFQEGLDNFSMCQNAYVQL